VAVAALMAGALAAGGVAVATADLVLVAISWRSRTVLGGLLGAIGIPLVAFAIASGPGGNAAVATLAIALIFLIVGAVLYGIGQVFERLLDADPEDEL
jgi:hypothetical protein